MVELHEETMRFQVAVLEAVERGCEGHFWFRRWGWEFGVFVADGKSSVGAAAWGVEE
jgi:hypothetical protein